MVATVANKSKRLVALKTLRCTFLILISSTPKLNWPASSERKSYSRHKTVVPRACSPVLPGKFSITTPSRSLENALFLDYLPSKEAKDHD